MHELASTFCTTHTAISRYEAKEMTLPTMQWWFSQARRQLERRFFEARWFWEIDGLLSVWSFFGNTFQEISPVPGHDFGDPVENREGTLDFAREKYLGR